MFLSLRRCWYFRERERLVEDYILFGLLNFFDTRITENTGVVVTEDLITALDRGSARVVEYLLILIVFYTMCVTVSFLIIINWNDKD